ncbi:hypothetical protein QMK19_26640 [Streptomyces sp. H10-C2]|uniref:hypothetical protein n=1 Tax=unclassified Streptomyces TaxID=2593676 RepID=UPI0024B88BDD|nr:MULTISPECIES: hypothetical protein [unclassified Streptomyces]MDJ0343612.1 hypothetical protein [Streptomyces sp. PH10-H1]MDJ0373140.1 hypothetical protein [Streptomyces sp. H10-C2]
MDPDDLTDVVRQMQHDLVDHVLQLIDDPGLLDSGLDMESDEPELGWELVAVRARRRPRSGGQRLDDRSTKP